MRRSEERALEAYPISMTPLNYQDLIDMYGGKTEIDTNSYVRAYFQKGYEQAEKDLREEIEKRIKAQFTKNGFPAGYICGIRIKIYEELLSNLF